MSKRDKSVVTDASDGGGRLTIAEDVLIGIAHTEAMATEGVMPPLEQGMLRRRSVGSPRLEVSNGEVVFHMTIGVRGGMRIPEVATNVRRRVAQAVHEKTGYMVRAVNLRVDHVDFGSSAPDAS